MSVLKYFKNTPRSPPIGRQALSVIFFKFAMRSLEEKKRPCRPPNGRQGPVAHPSGDRGSLSFESAICRHSLCHLSIKIQEKREG